MPETQPMLLALDFDGVLCDGLKEYFQVSWRAYCKIWSPPASEPPAGLAEQFYRLRPVIETGWEMPLVLRALELGISASEILTGWEAIAQSLMQQENLVSTNLSTTVDDLRDQWIATDVESWLALHEGYKGVGDRLNQILAGPTYTVIISTKESRFICELLHQQGIEFPAEHIFGKELKQPKAQTLRSLRQKLSPEGELSTWFVEDRFKTLKAIQMQSDLADVQLFLADWGYNTPEERELARQDSNIHLLTLEQFAQPFSNWLSH